MSPYALLKDASKGVARIGQGAEEGKGVRCALTTVQGMSGTDLQSTLCTSFL